MIVELESIVVVLNTGRNPVRILDIPQWKVEEGEQVAIFGPGREWKCRRLSVDSPRTSSKIVGLPGTPASAAAL